MNRDDIRAKVVTIVADQLNVDESDVAMDSRFVDDLGADSLDDIELLMACEEEFGIEIPDEDWDHKLLTVESVVDYLENRL